MDQLVNPFPDPTVPDEEMPAQEEQANPETGEVSGEYPQMPEMGGIAWTDVFLHYQDRNKNPAVTRINVTQRHPISATAALEMLLTELKAFMQTDLGKRVRFDNIPELPARQVERPDNAPAPQPQKAAAGFGQPAPQPAQKAAIGGQPPAPAQPPASGVTKSGKVLLEMIKIVPGDPGKQNVVEFHCAGLKYPLKEHRGPSLAAKHFDPEIGMTESFFETPGTYTPANTEGFGILYVYWEKGEKYTNVVRIARS